MQPSIHPDRAVRLAGSSLAYTWLPFEEALERLAELGFRFADLAAVPGWAHVEPDALADARERQRLVGAAAAAGLRVAALNAALGAPGHDAERRCRALAETALMLGASVVTLQAPNAGTPLTVAVAELAPVAAIAREAGVRFSLEIHCDRVTELPADAVALAEATGLGLTLDPSHIFAGPARGDGLAAVLPFVDHVHVRDARSDPPELQVPIGTGIVPFDSLFASLGRLDYAGIVSVEYVGRSAGESVDHDAVAAARLVAACWPGPLEGADAFATP